MGLFTLFKTLVKKSFIKIYDDVIPNQEYALPQIHQCNSQNFSNPFDYKSIYEQD